MRYLLTTSVVLSTMLALPASASVGAPVTFDGNTMNLINSSLIENSGAIELTNSGGQDSAAWLVSGLSTNNSFNATFTFSLAQNGSNPMADGITFALQNKSAHALGDNGGSLGYNGLDGVGSIIQTYTNNHVGLDTTGHASSAAAAPTNLGLAKSVTGNETIIYNANTNVLSMTGTLNVDGKNYDINDTKTINLFNKFGTTMYAGFTGATGGATSEQKITSFSMSTVSAVPEPENYAMLLAGLGLMGFMVRRRKTS